MKIVKINNKSLYCIGDEQLLHSDTIAVIGKRDATFRELAVSFQIGYNLAKHGYTIVNGIARGCDQAAIEGALQGGGKILIVMPCAIGEIYPASAQGLYNKILSTGGCIVSEYCPGTILQKRNFVERDEIQALLSKKVIVISAETKSGTMHTVKKAIKYNKDIACWCPNLNEAPSGNQTIVTQHIGTSISNIENIMKFVDSPDYAQIMLNLN